VKRIKAVLGKKWTYLLLLVALGWIFWLWILPYRYTAMALWGIAGTVGVYDLLARLGRKHPAPARRMRRLFTGCLCLILALMTVTGGLVLSGAGGAEDPACAYVVVLGAGVNGTQPSPSLEERLEAALAYLQTYPEAQCVVSGGQGGGENITEALCMYTWLTDRGIPPERIWQEERASSTQENLRFSLELIQEKTYTPVGALKSKTVNVRIIAATNENLKEFIKAKKFREDLYYRLRVIELFIPPLRDRADAIEPLVNFFISKYNDKFDTAKTITPTAVSMLKSYSWPGNIRELQYLIEKIIITSGRDIITTDDIPPLHDVEQKQEIPSDIPQEDDTLDFEAAVSEFESKILAKYYAHYKSSYKVADALGITQTKASRLLRKYQISK